MADFSVDTLAKYMELGLNIYIFGEHGTGKTFRLKDASKAAGLKLGYMSAPTLDAYVDLIGIPVAEENKELNRKVLEFIRKKEFDDIEVLFIDELPRGELKTLNAVFEVIQFGTINGDRALPKLKCVVAAGNPMTDEYVGQQQLDAALMDRFQVYLETSSSPDSAYFLNHFGKIFGKALIDWHGSHNREEDGYLSPRRLEDIGDTWKKISELATIKAMLPPGTSYKASLLHTQLQDAVRQERVASDPNASLVDKISLYSAFDVRSAREEIIEALPGLAPSDLSHVVENVAKKLSKGISTTKLVDEWGEFFEWCDPSAKTIFMRELSSARTGELLQKLKERNIRFGSKLSFTESLPDPEIDYGF